MALKPASTFTAIRTPIADPQTGDVRWEWVKKFQEWELKLQNGLDLIGQFIGTLGPQVQIAGRTGTISTALQNISGAGVLAATAISGTLGSAHLPTPTIGGIGGVQANNPVPHQWVNSIDTAGVPVLSQPGYGDIAGTPTLPATAAPVLHEWVNGYDAVTGLFSQAQPAYSDISGTPTGVTGTVTLAALTGPGTQGSITFANGIATGFVQPT